MDLRPTRPYLGRLAPSPTGHLHLGHARTFWIAAERARAAGGKLLLRNDDLDTGRCRPEFVRSMREDLAWLGLSWEEPMISQSERLAVYRAAVIDLHRKGFLFPCAKSRRDLAEALSAPHEGLDGPADEPLYPLAFRPSPDAPLPDFAAADRMNWRFRVPDGVTLQFMDTSLGRQTAICGVDLGDFLVWRKDGWPSYQLACAVDDGLLGITEVVRGADLVRSTFRQMLILQALGWPLPSYHHCALMTDDHGVRLAKRNDALSLRALRAEGRSPEDVRALFAGRA